MHVILTRKPSRSECGDTDQMKAIGIANAYNYTYMYSILSQHVNRIIEQSILTFQPYKDYCDNTWLPLLSITLSLYKQAFNPAQIDPNQPIMSVLSDIHDDMCRDDSRWKKVQEVVVAPVLAVNEHHSDLISNCIDR